MTFSFKSIFRYELEIQKIMNRKRFLKKKHTLDISINEFLKFFFDNVFIVNEIWASAVDIASRFILFDTAEADEDDVWDGMFDGLILFNNL